MGNSGRTMAALARERAQQARERAQQRKEEFLAARVPKELRDKVFKRAEAEGISVSILIRKILEQAFADSPSAIAQAEVGAVNTARESKIHTPRFPNVLGWETISLYQNASCSECARVLMAGHKAVVGISATGGSPILLCASCHTAIGEK